MINAIRYILLPIGLTTATPLWSQVAGDTLQPYQAQEIVITGERSATDKTTKPLATLDNFLDENGSINMIRRGSYAWEPFLNGMSSERSIITIDGMRIYGACTDKMDPVTSYVEITNLSKANIHNAASGTSSGSSIAGSLDLVRKKGTFGEYQWKGNVLSGIESNNKHLVGGAGLGLTSPKVFADVDFTFRNADNYKAGGNREVNYSQFTKYNSSMLLGIKTGEHSHLEASLIYDLATDVGYPALPMDVSQAKAFIGSIEWIRHHLSPSIMWWKTKIYFNDITHIMDDSQRPDVPIRMDMPGWSKTAGFYSFMQGNTHRDFWKITVSGHANRSLAEMTMYSNNPGEKPMFMLTWPGVNTFYFDLHADEKRYFNERWSATVNAGIALHQNEVYDKFGFESLKIFYPQLATSKTRVLKRFAAGIQYQSTSWTHALTASWNERAPSVSEGYGFYLFNSFDRYDYIGNPELSNEQSASIQWSSAWNQQRWNAKFSVNYFNIHHYIIGRPSPSLSAMTIGAAGIKIYEQLEYAHLANLNAELHYTINDQLQWNNQWSYRRGISNTGENLPMIQPFCYLSTLKYNYELYSAELHVNGASKQNHYNPEFGEAYLPDYAILGISVSKRFILSEQSLLIKIGVDNLLDANYTTFSDWNRLPRMGRNFYVHVLYKF